jgi:hypothetical protein
VGLRVEFIRTRDRWVTPLIEGLGGEAPVVALTMVLFGLKFVGFLGDGEMLDLLRSGLRGWRILVFVKWRLFIVKFAISTVVDLIFNKLLIPMPT